jgi:LSD1 subclass zinc finger protein
MAPKTLRIMCPNLKCRSILVVPETARGKNVKCSNCATLFKIPAQPPAPVPAGSARN